MKSTDDRKLFGAPIAAAAVAGNIATIPQTQATAGDGTASVALGFPPETFIARAAGGEPPRGQDMNGLLNLLSSALQVLQAGYLGPFDAAFAQSIGGYPAGAVVAGAVPGAFWVSTVDANVSTPGATGATWQSLFNGYATQDWSRTQFLQLALATLQNVSGPVAFGGQTTVPGIAAFTGADALNAVTAEGRYVRSAPASGSTNTRITDIAEDTSGDLIATLSDGTTKNYIPSGQIVQANSAYAKAYGGNGNVITADSNITLTRKSIILVTGCSNFAYVTSGQSGVSLVYSANGGAFTSFGTSDVTLASCIYVTGTLVLDAGSYTLRLAAENGNNAAIGWSAVLSYIAVSV